MEHLKGIEMELFIRDRNVLLIKALLEHEWPDNVTIEVGDILKEPAEALVSPANSFGYMDGGVDRYYCEKIGWHLHSDMQQYIKNRTQFGELYIGQAMWIPTGDANFPKLICAPTMRLPMPIPAHNVFLATRAAIDIALFLKVKTCAMPGMGTGTGRVPPEEAAEAMFSGYKAAQNWYALNR